MTDARTAVQLADLHHRYGPVTALAGVDLVIEPATTVAMLGPNGAGKSTTMNLLLGLLPIQHGAVAIFGEPPSRAVALGWVGAMLQETRLVPHLRVGELLNFVRGLYPDPMPLGDLLDLADLTDVRRRPLERLSGGQSQRVKFALAIAGRPRLLILDEPTAAMDVQSRQAFWRGIGEYADAGHTVLFSTHHLEEADRNADRIVVISAGRIAADGTPAALRGTIDRRVVSIAGCQDLEWGELPGVTGVALTPDRVVLTTADADATVTALARAAAVVDLEISGADLEEAFLAITAQPDHLPQRDHPASDHDIVRSVR
jgi:ABC-2 type transport system ATP-binding protein